MSQNNQNSYNQFSKINQYFNQDLQYFNGQSIKLVNENKSTQNFQETNRGCQYADEQTIQKNKFNQIQNMIYSETQTIASEKIEICGSYLDKTSKQLFLKQAGNEQQKSELIHEDNDHFKYDKIQQENVNSEIQQIAIPSIHQSIYQEFCKSLADEQVQSESSFEDIENIDEKKVNQKQYFIHSLKQDKYADVQLTYRSDLSTFIVKKQNLFDQQEYDNECKINNLLKGESITLDFISQDEDNQQFEQIAGKTNLFILKQKLTNKHVFEMSFLVLLQKLNRMHELNVAHGDIKPENIVITYDNQVFFIDFGSSVLLSDYSNYLQSYTQKYNLDIYLNNYVDNNSESEIKQFNSQEEVKLCDRTQLVLSFLLLFCDDLNQQQLFINKDFNQLLENLYDSNKQYAFYNSNRKIIISLMSKILNEADQTIQVMECDQEQIININYKIISDDLLKSNDIVYSIEQNLYQVQRIDKNSIQLLYLLDKKGFNIEIIPNQMIIIPQPETKEYQYICQKYKQIDIYHTSLIQNKQLYNIDIQNICEYLKIIKNKSCLINLEHQYSLLFKKINNFKFLDTLSLTFQIKAEFFQKFIEYLNMTLPEYYISGIAIFYFGIQCKISKYPNFPQKTEDIQLNINIPYIPISQYEESFNLIKNKFNIKQINIIIVEHLTKYIEDLNYIDTQIQYLMKNFYLQQENDTSQICFQITKNIKSEQEQQQSECKEQLNQNQLNEYINEESNLNIKQFYEFDELLNIITCPINKQYEINKNQFNKTEQIIYQTLLNLNQLFKNSLKMMIKFENFLFQETKIWEEFQKMLVNQDIEVTLINCQFSKTIIEYLKDSIQLQSSLIKYQFQIQTNPSQQYDSSSFNQEYQVNIQFSPKQQCQNGLNILIFKQQQIEDLQEKQIDKQLQTQINNITQTIQPDNQLGLENDQIDIEGIKKIIVSHGSYKNKIPNKMIIPIRQQDYILKVNQRYKQAIDVSNINDIKYIINDLKMLTDYKEIRIQNQNNMFSYIREINTYNVSTTTNITMKYYFDSNLNILLAQFYQLYLTFIGQQQKMIERKQNQFSLIQNISHIKNYSSYAICQSINDSLSFNDDILDFSENYSENPSNQKQPKFLEYSFILQGDTDNKIAESDIEEKIFNKDEFIINFIDFQKNYCITNQEAFNHTLKIQNFIVVLNFKSLNIGDSVFKELFIELEKLFFLNNRKYIIQQCGVTKQTLHNIYEVIKHYDQGQRIKFDLQKNNISFFELKQLIKQIILDNSIHEFIFAILCSDDYIGSVIENEFKEYIKKYKSNLFLMLHYKPKTEKTSKCIFKIDLYFNDNHFRKLAVLRSGPIKTSAPYSLLTSQNIFNPFSYQTKQSNMQLNSDLKKNKDFMQMLEKEVMIALREQNTKQKDQNQFNEQQLFYQNVISDKQSSQSLLSNDNFIQYLHDQKEQQKQNQIIQPSYFNSLNQNIIQNNIQISKINALQFQKQFQF